MIDSYDKLTIGKYRELMALEKEDDLTYGVKILSILSDIDEDELMDMPLEDFSGMMAKTKFLYRQVDKLDYNHLNRNITINGKKYEIIKDAKKMTAGQYIDYNAYIKKDNFMEMLPFILTTFIIPKGHKYCDDYDAEDLARELDEHLDIRTALCISDFFLHQSHFSIKSSLLYLKWQMKRTMRKETNKEIQEKMKEGLEQIEYLETLLEHSVGFTQQ